MAENRSKRRKKNKARKKLIRRMVLLLLIVVIIALAGMVGILVYDGIAKGGNSTKEAEAVEKEEVELPTVVTVDGYDISKYSMEDLKARLIAKYPWNIKVKCEGSEFDVDNGIEESVSGVLRNAYSQNTNASFEVKLSEQQIDSIVAKTVERADVASDTLLDNDELMVYNEETGSFDFFDGKPHTVLDVESLKADLKSLIQSGSYEGTVEAKYTTVDSDVKAADFALIGTYTTHTTNNKDRNVNVSLACAAVNGTILQPGQQFSYNECLGKRTDEKGYKPAGAYSNGEHVLELGGGVCQLSSTLYNAVFASNLQVDERTGHTYEPTYVTPGEDATVSFPNPDFKFTNSTSAPVGITVSFENRTVVVNVYGIPQLDEGVIRYMRSEKVADLEPPMPVYVENPAVVPGFEFVVGEGKPGSKWVTYEVLEKDGEVIKEEYLHSTSYKGEPATIQVNTSGVYVEPAPVDVAQ